MAIPLASILEVIELAPEQLPNKPLYYILISFKLPHLTSFIRRLHLCLLFFSKYFAYII